MAQASSAQREPSMEEILASIRRIIEDSDTDKKRDDFQPSVIAANDGLEAAKDVEAFRAEFGTATMQEPVPAAEPVPAVQQPSLAAVAEHPVPSVEAVSFQRPPVLDMAQAPREAFAPAPEFDSESEELTASAVESELEALVRADVEAEQPVREPVAEAAFAAAAEASLRPALMSERPGRQVAAAFEELSEAFAASRRRSFDEMAEEMLRPMLQDWLDNNLPHLVERLVREEIERIARG